MHQRVFTVHRHAIGILAIIFVRMQLNQRLQSICQSRRRRRRRSEGEEEAEVESTEVDMVRSHTAYTFWPHIRWGLNAKRNFNRLNINNSLIQLSDYYYYYYSVFLFCCSSWYFENAHTRHIYTHQTQVHQQSGTQADLRWYNFFVSSSYFTYNTYMYLYSVHLYIHMQYACMQFHCSFISLLFHTNAAKWKKCGKKLLWRCCDGGRARAHNQFF